jgi:NADH-quinone oxidoreductase subunit N
MSVVILVLAGLITPIFYRKNIQVAKGIAVIAFGIAFYFVFRGDGIGEYLPGFSLTPDIQLIEYALLITLAAVSLSLTGFERPLIAQMLFLSAVSLALLETTNLFIYIVLFEAVAIISYILVANIRNFYNAEGAIKAFIAGAVASGIILFGLALFSFVSPSFDYNSITVTGKFTLIAVAIMLAGIFYKLTIVPMHGWAADAYAQINHVAAAILSGVIKVVVLVATFNAFKRFLEAYPTMAIILFGFFAVLTMTLANFMALWQKRISKVLAYSSIAHSGYVLIPFAAVGSKYAYAGVLYYAIAYLFMQTAVFLVLNELRVKGGIKYIKDLRGLGYRHPLLALFFTIQIFSLAGIPLLAGFMSKAVAFYAGVDAGLWWLVLIALLNSALAVAYYVALLKNIYLDEPVTKQPLQVSYGVLLGQLILAAGTFYFGIVAADIFNVTMPLH